MTELATIEPTETDTVEVLTGPAIAPVPASMKGALSALMGRIDAVIAAEGRVMSAQTVLMIHLAVAAKLGGQKVTTVRENLTYGIDLDGETHKKLRSAIGTAERAANRLVLEGPKDKAVWGKSHTAAVKTLTAAIGNATATDIIALKKPDIDAGVVRLAIIGGESADAAREVIETAKARENAKNAAATAERKRLADIARAGGPTPSGPDAPKGATPGDAPVAPTEASVAPTGKADEVADRQAVDVEPVGADIMAVVAAIAALGAGKMERLADALADSDDFGADAWDALHAAFDAIALEWSERAEATEGEAIAS